VTSNGVPCRLDGINFDPPVLMEDTAQPRKFSRTRAADVAIRHTCAAQHKLKGSLAEPLPVVERLMRVGRFSIVSLREQAKQELDLNAHSS
jgi:hypothetical protein